jgi:hypothetical protein
MAERLSAIEIGSAKVRTILAEGDASGIRVLGLGVAPSKGLQKGIIININEARNAIRRSVLMAEQSSGCHIDPVATRIAGKFLDRDVIALIKEILPGCQEPDAGNTNSAVMNSFLEILNEHRTLPLGCWPEAQRLEVAP